MLLCSIMEYIPCQKYVHLSMLITQCTIYIAIIHVGHVVHRVNYPFDPPILCSLSTPLCSVLCDEPSKDLLGIVYNIHTILWLCVRPQHFPKWRSRMMNVNTNTIIMGYNRGHSKVTRMQYIWSKRVPESIHSYTQHWTSCYPRSDFLVHWSVLFMYVHECCYCKHGTSP